MDTTTDTMLTQAGDRFATWHPPHFRAARPHPRWPDQILFEFTGFTGDEPKPDRHGPHGMYDDDSLTREDRELLSSAHKSAWLLWEQAKFYKTAAPVLRKAEPVWRDYARARETMDTAGAALDNPDGGDWHALAVTLIGTHETVLAAAAEWDRCDRALAQANHDHFDALGEYNDEHVIDLRTVAGDIGIDTSGWHLSGYYERPGWGGDTPLVAAVKDEIQQQLRRIAKVEAVCGAANARPAAEGEPDFDIDVDDPARMNGNDVLRELLQAVITDLHAKLDNDTATEDTVASLQMIARGVASSMQATPLPVDAEPEPNADPELVAELAAAREEITGLRDGAKRADALRLEAVAARDAAVSEAKQAASERDEARGRHAKTTENVDTAIANLMRAKRFTRLAWATAVVAAVIAVVLAIV